MEIRDVVDSDWAAVWGFLQQIVAAGDTYCWPPDTSEDAARTWILATVPEAFRHPERGFCWASHHAPVRAIGHPTWRRARLGEGAQCWRRCAVRGSPDWGEANHQVEYETGESMTWEKP